MSAFQKYRYNNLLVNTKDYVMIVVGLMIYAIGFTACILPHKVVMGGLTGVGTLVYFATDGAVSVAVTSYVLYTTAPPGEPTSWRQWCRNSAMSASAVRSSAWI